MRGNRLTRGNNGLTIWNILNIKHPRGSRMVLPHPKLEIQTSSEAVYHISIGSRRPQVLPGKQETTQKGTNKIHPEICLYSTRGIIWLQGNLHYRRVCVRLWAKEQGGGKHARARKEKSFFLQHSPLLCHKDRTSHYDSWQGETWRAQFQHDKPVQRRAGLEVRGKKLFLGTDCS